MSEHEITTGPTFSLQDPAARGPVTHHLKCWPEGFAALRAGVKTYEVRRDDRQPRFEAGDRLVISEWDPNVGSIHGGSFPAGYTGRDDEYVVTHVTRGPTVWGFPAGFAILGVRKVS